MFSFRWNILGHAQNVSYLIHLDFLLREPDTCFFYAYGWSRETVSEPVSFQCSEFPGMLPPVNTMTRAQGCGYMLVSLLSLICGWEITNVSKCSGPPTTIGNIIPRQRWVSVTASRCELITQGTRRFCWSQIRFLRSLVSLAIIKSLAEITCCGWSLNVRFCSCLTRSHHWTVSRWSTNLLPLRSWHFLAGPIQYKTNYSLWFQPVPRVRACILPVSIPVAHFLFLFLRAM